MQNDMVKAVLVVAIVVAGAVIAWALWPAAEEAPPAPPPQPITDEPAPPPLTPPQPVVTPEPEPAVPEPPPEPEPDPLPALVESDPFVRERLEPMELPAPWLEQGDYVRRLAVLAENASRGDYPRRQLGFLQPGGPFKVTRDGERIFLDPASYNRYDRYLARLEGVEPAELAGLLGTIDPLLETALGELGVQAPPGEVFATALAQVMQVPVLPGDGRVELLQPNVMFEYANPELESLSPLQKQVLRMGPKNVERLQAYLGRLAEAMDLEPAR